MAAAPCLLVDADLMAPGGLVLARRLQSRLPCRGLYAVAGPNGSGKTLLLQGLAGLRRSLWGNVWVAKPRLLLPAAPVAPRRISVKRWLRVNGARDAAQLLPGWVLEAKIGRLSMGWRRLVELAAALFSRARVVLVDEPFTNLDAERRLVAERLLAAAALEKLVVTAVHPGDVPRGALVAIELGVRSGA